MLSNLTLTSQVSGWGWLAERLSQSVSPVDREQFHSIWHLPEFSRESRNFMDGQQLHG
ncbi:MAG: hypothetical protein OXC07_11240 [Kistimonas sp.]|nr:hypothetical protein [Kistimonas sp.]